ncbi:hypothetical protein L519_4818 [Bordetella bronchiseptica MBORD678]|nr:hypothetical protein L519_4818 [Bordetella bronchiseptica MBORD678]
MAGGGAVKGTKLLPESRMNACCLDLRSEKYPQKYPQIDGAGG